MRTTPTTFAEAEVSEPNEVLRLRLIRTDLGRFTEAGYGWLFGDKALGLSVGQIIAVTDDEADTVAARVLEVHDAPERKAQLQVNWDNVLRTA